MSEKNVWVVGHKNPDTDSICAAICYANLKNELEKRKPEADRKVYVPKRAGAVSAETNFVLNYFGKKAPRLVTDAGTQIRDITIRRTEGVDKGISMKKAWELMKILRVVTLPILGPNKNLEGLIVTADIAQSYMDVYDNRVLAKARTPYRNIIETLEGKMLVGNEYAFFVNGRVIVGARTAEQLADYVEKDDLVIVSDREDAQMACINHNAACVVVTNGVEISKKVINAARMKDVTLISTPYDTFTASRLINQSIPIRYFMTTKDIVSFNLDDYIDDVRETVGKIRHRDFPILDENQNYVGMFSRRNLMNIRKKQLVLVDHNEKSQAVDNVDEAEILEIIDHHRIGSLETMSPVYFRNQPLGCTGTIIYQMYQEKNVEVTPEIAGLLCSAIISDTLMFRSPTCTHHDQDACMELAEIAGINVEEYAEKMFEAGSDFASKTEEEIINMDFKIFYAGKTSFGVAQVSSMGRRELEKLKDRIYPEVRKEQVEKGLDMMYVMLTDIRGETTYLIYSGTRAAEIAAFAFNKPQEEDGLILKGVVSRKKQMVPELMRAITEIDQ